MRMPSVCILIQQVSKKCFGCLCSTLCLLLWGSRRKHNVSVFMVKPNQHWSFNMLWQNKTTIIFCIFPSPDHFEVMEQSRQFSSKPTSYPTPHCRAVVLKTAHAVCCMKSECRCSYLLSLFACTVNRSASCSSVYCWSRRVHCPIKKQLSGTMGVTKSTKISRITTLIFLFLAT